MIRNKRVKQRFQAELNLNMKSCDFLFLALLGIVAVYYDNFFACLSQSWNVPERCFKIEPLSLNTNSQKCDPEALKSAR